MLSMPALDLVQTIPLILQLVTLILLTLFVVLSIAGRHPRFHFIWRDMKKVQSPDHVVKYTVVPILVWFVVLAVVIDSWQSDVEWTAGWEVKNLVVGPGIIILSLALITAAAVLFEKIDTSNAKNFKAWIPLIMVLISVVGFCVGVWMLCEAADN